MPVAVRSQTPECKRPRGKLRKSAGVCDNLWQAARNLLILNGEMSEWLKEHAWKTNPATLTEEHRNISSRNQFNDVPL